LRALDALGASAATGRTLSALSAVCARRSSIVDEARAVAAAAHERPRRRRSDEGKYLE
jgi:hypothetical protein